MRRTLATIALSMMFALPAFAHKHVTKSAKPAAVAADSAAAGDGTAPAATDDAAKPTKAKKKHHKHSKKAKETPAPAEDAK